MAVVGEEGKGGTTHGIQEGGTEKVNIQPKNT